MADYKYQGDKVMLEDKLQVSDYEREEVGKTFETFYRSKSERSGAVKQFQHHSFDEYLKKSRLLFWNSVLTESEDLRELDLEFALPFARKEVMDFLGRITSLGLNPVLSGNGIGQGGVKVLQAIYKKWRLKSKDKVEKFWQTLYGVVNGTLCLSVGFDGEETEKKYLRSYDVETGAYDFEKKLIAMWNDVTSEVVPIEEMYLSKIYQRDIQKQGITIRKQEMDWAEFKSSKYGKSPRAQFVYPGAMLAEDSLYHQLLANAGSMDRITILTEFDTYGDTQKIIAGGVLLNGLGSGKTGTGLVTACSPNPFHHKSQPYVWSVHAPVDEKFAYGLSMPFMIKDTHKILNTSITMMLERELRAIDPPIITSDFEAPQIIFGQKKIVPVNDINAYKEFNISEASNQYFTMMNSLQGTMTAHAQGGMSQIIPSRQPKSAREVVAMENIKKESLGNSIILYFDVVYQELLLVVKTALQFYQSGKFDSEELARTIVVSDMPLSEGGIGTLEVRIVKKPKEAVALHFEKVQKSIENGKTTEIIEIPIESLNNLIFYIDDIKLEPERSSDLEVSMYVENVLKPIVEVFAPAGIVDMGKTFLRFMEKAGETPSDYVSNENISALMSSWGNRKFQMPPQMGGGQGPKGALMQSGRGMIGGGQSMGGYPELA